MKEPIQRRPSWLRFSLRTLLVVMTVLCIWLGFKVNAARRQREAVTAITKVGGDVWFDYQLTLSPSGSVAFSRPNALPHEPIWLRSLFGDNFFHKVLVAEAQPALHTGTFEFSDLNWLAGLPDLTVLILDGIKIKKDTITARRPVIDSDMCMIAQLDQLRSLGLNHTAISGEGISQLANKRNLKVLSFMDTPITDSGLEVISGLASIEDLTLYDTRITNEGLRHLERLPHLSQFDLWDYKITDDGIRYLKQLKGLQSLTLRSTNVTDDGVRDLKAALPNTTITIQ